jgi:polysaccharide biosynthesis/export protein
MRILLFFTGLLLLSSCISNRKTTLLQKKDLHAKNLPKDTVVRAYDVEGFKYHIQANDILSVQFESLTPEKYDFLSKRAGVSQNINLANGGALIIGQIVDEKGEIPFPVMGKIKVGGLTIFEVQEKLQEAANLYLESPVVKVSLLNFRVTLMGEFLHEGTILLTNNRVSMLEVIGLAGGLGEFADRSNVKLVRYSNGKTEIQYLNLLDENFINSPYYYANQNDVLIVPPLKQKPFRKYFGQNFSLVVSTMSLVLLVFNLTK